VIVALLTVLVLSTDSLPSDSTLAASWSAPRLVFVADSAPIALPTVTFRPAVVDFTARAVTAVPIRAIALDTLPKKRPRAIAYSEWYGRRLAIHRTLSWAMIPLFAASYVTGDKLLNDGRENSPDWVRTVHPLAAGGSAVVFGVNTVTGLWNLWDSRKDPNGRTRRLIHAGLLLAADAGFVYTGSLGDDARENGDIRRRHRTFAISSMAVSTASWVYMLVTK
jgi:hypothetical protein